MNKKIVALLLAALFVVSGCGAKSGDTAKNEQVLTVSMAGSPTDISPLTVSTTEGADLLGAMYETLVRQDKDGSVKQGSGLAESWTVDDTKKVYTFKLRDAKWSDGKAITAKDFVYCWQKVLDPNTASTYAYMLYPIVNAYEYNTGKVTDANQVGVKAIDDKTLEVTLTAPTTYFVSALVIPQFGALPEGIVETMGDDFYLDKDHMVFNGPFVLTDWQTDQSMTFVKNENYWDADNVKLDKLVYNFVMETNTIVNMYETGSLDIMQVQPEFTANYKDKAGYVSVSEPVTEYVKFNFDNEFFANENIRRAFSLAINRVSYINDFMQSGSTPAYAYIPPAISGSEGKEFREENGDLYYDAGNNDNASKEAVELLNTGLKEVGKTFEEFNKGLSLVIGEGDANLKTAQVFQEYWKNVLGVDVEVRSMKYALRQDAYDTKNFTIAKEGWGADYNDPLSFLDLFESDSAYNDVGYKNPKYDELIEKSRTLSGDERMDVLKQAEKLLIQEDFVIAPTFYQTRHWVEQDYVKDVVRHGIGLRADYKWAHIEKSK